MAKLYPGIEKELADWIGRQKVFFVATAPTALDGHINCSPKGGDAFRILDPETVAYLDLTGSGVETIAHLRENGRIVIMFCAFDGPPMIVRLHGRGEILMPDHPEFGTLAGRFSSNPGARAVIRIRLDRVSDSCGYGVPFLSYEGDRDTLDRWAEAKGTDGLSAYRKDNNTRSIDDLPGLVEETNP